MGVHGLRGWAKGCIGAAVAACVSLCAQAGVIWDGDALVAISDKSWGNPANWNDDTLPLFDGTDDILLAGSGASELGADRYISSLTANQFNGHDLHGTGGYVLTLGSGNITRSFNSGSPSALNIYADLLLGGDGIWRNDSANYTLRIHGTVGQTGGNRGVTKVGTGNVALRGLVTYAGPTYIKEGIFALQAAGAAPNTSFVIDEAGTFNILDGSPVNSDRLGATAGITVRGGSFIYENTASTISSETFGTVTVDRGYGKLRLNYGGSSGTESSIELSVDDLQRIHRGVLMMNGLNGSLGRTGTSAATRLLAATPPAMVGGSGSAGSPDLPIIPWIVGNDATGDFVTYDSSTGFRPLDRFNNEYATTITPNTTSTNNVRLSSGTSLSGTTTINSLNWREGNISGTGTLRITSGGIISSGNFNRTISGVMLDFGSTEGIVSHLAAGNLFLDSTIQGSGGMTYQGSAIIVRGNNTYTGGTVINGGTVSIGNANALSTGDITINGGGAFRSGLGAYQGVRYTLANPINLHTDVSLGTLTLNGPIVLNDGNRLIASTNTYFNGTIQEDLPGRSLTISGGSQGTDIRISGVNTFTGGFTLVDGTLKVGGNVTPGVAGPLGSSALPIVLGANTAFSTPTLLIDGAYAIGRDIVIPGVTGSGGSNYGAALGTVGADSGQIGNVTIGSDGSSVNKTININVPAGGRLEVSGDITEAAGYLGSGHLGFYGDTVLSGNNTYAGSTTVVQGRLTVNGQIDPGSSYVNVRQNGTLGGTGTIERPVQIDADNTDADSVGGKLSPGQSAGTLTVADLIVGDLAVYEWELGSSLVEFDQVVVLDALSFGANAILELNNLNGLDPTGQDFVLFSYGGVDPTNPNWILDYGITGWSGGEVLLDTASNQIVLTGLVPEPNVGALLLLGLVSVLRRPVRV